MKRRVMGLVLWLLCLCFSTAAAYGEPWESDSMEGERQTAYMLTEDDVELSYLSIPDNGSVRKPGVTLSALAQEYGNTYTVEYRNNTHPGKAMVIVQGTGNLYGRVVKYFTIRRKLDPGDFDIRDKNSFSGNCYIYKGKAIRPVIVHPDKMKEGRDYTITYQNNAHPGSGLAIVTGKGKYCGRVRLRFNIFLARIENLQATNTPKGVRLLWGRVKGANGYRVYRTRLSDGSSSCIGTVSRGNVTSFVDKKAEAREPLAYYVYASYTGRGKTAQGLGSKVLATAYIPRVDLRQTYFEKKSKSISICCPWKSIDSDVCYKLELSRNKRFRGFQEVNMGKTKKGKRILMKISGSAGSFKKGAYYYVRVRAYTNIVYEDNVDHYRKIRVYSCYSKVRRVKFQ